MLVNAKELVDKMTLEEKAGQLLLVTFPEQELDLDWEDHIRKHKFAGILLNRDSLDNEAQTRTLIDAIQAMYLEMGSGMPSFITIQQEGGVANSLLFGKVVSPGNMAIGASRNSEFAYEAARLSAEELKSYGFNLVLAPVLDINSTPFNPIIGARSFGENNDLVTQMGVKAVRGYQENGLACCAKHFPGLGAITQDPRQLLPTLMHTDRKFLDEMKPFVEAINRSRVEAIMVGHASYPIILRDGKPASLSPSMIGYHLRMQLKFKGVVISDFIDMGAVISNHTIEEAVLLALKAGVDLILVGPDMDVQQKAYNSVKTAIESGYLEEEPLNQSLQRIIRQKHRRSQMRQPMREDPTTMMSRIARESVTLVKNDGNLLPLKMAEEEYIGVIQPEFPHPDMPTFSELLTVKYPWVDEFNYNINDFELDWESLTEKMSQCKIIIFCSYHDGLMPDHQVAWVKKLYEIGKPIIGLAMNSPYHLTQYNREVRAALLTYGASHYSLEAAVEILLGEASPKGHLPVTLPDLYEYGHSLSY